MENRTLLINIFSDHHSSNHTIDHLWWGHYCRAVHLSALFGVNHCIGGWSALPAAEIPQIPFCYTDVFCLLCHNSGAYEFSIDGSLERWNIPVDSCNPGWSISHQQGLHQPWDGLRLCQQTGICAGGLWRSQEIKSEWIWCLPQQRNYLLPSKQTWRSVGTIK